MNATVSWIQASLETIGALNRQNGELDITFLYPHIETMISVAQTLAERIIPGLVQTIVSVRDPFSIALTQLVVFHMMARDRKTQCCPKMIYPDENEILSFHQTFLKYINGNRILVLQGVITTGNFHETLALIKSIRREGGEVVGLVTLCNKAHLTVSFQNPNDLGIISLL